MGLKLTVIWLGIILMIPSITVLKNAQPNPRNGEKAMDDHIIRTYPPECDATSENDPSMKDNAAHFMYYQDEPNIKYWREWWYLNVYDNNGDKLVIMFLTLGDLNKAYASLALVILVFMGDDGTMFWTVSPYPISQYIPDYEKCNVHIGKNRFVALSENTYQIIYQNPIHSLDLNLTLIKSRRGIKHGNCVTPLGDWELMGWCIPVSYGNVTGDLRFVDNQGQHQYTINGEGYHDHNWGLIKWNELNWDWGAFSDKSFPFSIVYGRTTYNGTINGNINIVNETHVYSILCPELKIEYAEWTQIGRYNRPSKIHVHGESGNCSINMTIDLVHPYIIGVRNIGHPYLLGRGQGSMTLDNRTYVFQDLIGFYEFHDPNS